MSERPSVRIGREVGSWPGVSTSETERGTPGFYYGKVELGHLHGDTSADLPFPKKVRDGLIAEGRASVHPPLPKSGWVRRRTDGPGDAEAAIGLFRENYERQGPRRAAFRAARGYE